MHRCFERTSPVSTFHLQLNPAATCFKLRSAVTYTKFKHSQIITYKHNLMEFEVNSVFHSDIYIKAQVKTQINQLCQI